MGEIWWVKLRKGDHFDDLWIGKRKVVKYLIDHK
jgi:hypothetical protein